MKKVSIVIPTYNKLMRLRLTLKSLEPQVDKDVEVIVVFDGCDKEVIEDFHKLTFSYKPIEIINEKNIGRARARNEGIKAATGEIVIFLDDDRLVNPEYIKAHRRLHEKGYGVVLGMRNQLFMKDDDIRKFYDDPSGLCEYCEKYGEIENYVFPKGSKSRFRWLNFFTGNVSVDRQALLDAGCFDDAFQGWGHEDVDLGIRLYLNGQKFGYSGRAINYHLMHASNFDSKKESCCRNLRYMIKKYNKHIGVKTLLFLLYCKESVMGAKISKNQLVKYEMLSQS